MMLLAKALVLTALTVAVWLYVVRFNERTATARAACSVGYVYDGDTVALDCGAGERTARVIGFDTPETKEPRCAAELAAGKAATVRFRGLLRAGVVTSVRKGHDKYGRVLVQLFVDGVDVAQTMVREGHAVAYRGGARINWCARLGA